MQPLYCRGAYGMPGLMNPQPGDCQALYVNPANSSASPHWNPSWNKDVVGGGHGGGEVRIIGARRSGAPSFSLATQKRATPSMLALAPLPATCPRSCRKPR